MPGHIKHWPTALLCKHILHSAQPNSLAMRKELVLTICCRAEATARIPLHRRNKDTPWCKASGIPRVLTHIILIHPGPTQNGMPIT